MGSSQSRQIVACVSAMAAFTWLLLACPSVPAPTAPGPPAGSKKTGGLQDAGALTDVSPSRDRLANEAAPVTPTSAPVPDAAPMQCEPVRLRVGAKPLGYKARGKVCDGERQGKWRFTFLDGRRLREGAYERGRETGRWRMWYRHRGRRRAEGDYRRGRRVGGWTRWHHNGQRSLQGTYREGLRHGRWRRWHRNGTLYEDRWYVDGKREGNHWRWDRKGRGTLVRACSADVCKVLCRGGRKRHRRGIGLEQQWCSPTEHPAVEEAMPSPARPASAAAP